MWGSDQRVLTLVDRVDKFQKPAVRYLIGRQEQFAQLRRRAPSKCFAQRHETTVAYVVVIQIQGDENLYGMVGTSVLAEALKRCLGEYQIRTGHAPGPKFNAIASVVVCSAVDSL